MSQYDIYEWEWAVGLPSASACRQFCRKADIFLRKRGQYVGPMKPFDYTNYKKLNVRGAKRSPAKVDSP